MCVSLAQHIAETALALARSHPRAPALAVLDLAMKGREGGEFPGFDEPGVPVACSAFLPSPFASLLRTAFMPAWADADFAPPQRGTLGTTDASSQLWALHVLAEFAERYRLEESRARWRYVF